MNRLTALRIFVSEGWIVYSNIQYTIWLESCPVEMGKVGGTGRRLAVGPFEETAKDGQPSHIADRGLLRGPSAEQRREVVPQISLQRLLIDRIIDGRKCRVGPTPGACGMISLTPMISVDPPGAKPGYEA